MVAGHIVFAAALLPLLSLLASAQPMDVAARAQTGGIHQPTGAARPAGAGRAAGRRIRRRQCAPRPTDTTDTTHTTDGKKDATATTTNVPPPAATSDVPGTAQGQGESSGPGQDENKAGTKDDKVGQKGQNQKDNEDQKDQNGDKDQKDQKDNMDNKTTPANSGVLLQVNDPKCGDSGASDEFPNGTEDWMNCGLESGGWTPPRVTVDQLKAVELSADGVFAPCAPYFDKFRQYAGEFGIPPIMLASFALQESTCNPGTRGGNGEAGMMQLGQENCAGAADCFDVDFNIRQGAKYFADTLAANDHNVFLAIGTYNGWHTGLTYEQATKAAREGNCHAQNNADYLFQMVNGWMQGKDGHALGKYHNLDHC